MALTLLMSKLFKSRAILAFIFPVAESTVQKLSEVAPFATPFIWVQERLTKAKIFPSQCWVGEAERDKPKEESVLTREGEVVPKPFEPLSGSKSCRAIPTV